MNDNHLYKSGLHWGYEFHNLVIKSFIAWSSFTGHSKVSLQNDPLGWSHFFHWNSHLQKCGYTLQSSVLQKNLTLCRAHCWNLSESILKFAEPSNLQRVIPRALRRRGHRQLSNSEDALSYCCSLATVRTRHSRAEGVKILPLFCRWNKILCARVASKNIKWANGSRKCRYNCRPHDQSLPVMLRVSLLLICSPQWHPNWQTFTNHHRMHQFG